MKITYASTLVLGLATATLAGCASPGSSDDSESGGSAVHESASTPMTRSVFAARLDVCEKMAIKSYYPAEPSAYAASTTCLQELNANAVTFIDARIHESMAHVDHTTKSVIDAFRAASPCTELNDTKVRRHQIDPAYLSRCANDHEARLSELILSHTSWGEANPYVGNAFSRSVLEAAVGPDALPPVSATSPAPTDEQLVAAFAKRPEINLQNVRSVLLYWAKSELSDDPRSAGAVELIMTNMFDDKQFVADDALCTQLASTGSTAFESPFFCSADAAARFRTR